LGSTNVDSFLAHLAFMSARRKKVDALQYDSTFDDSSDELFIGTVSVDSVQQSEDWKERADIQYFAK
jgi:hypothetical protein